MGTSFLYLADTVIKFKAGAKLEPEKDFGVKGFINNAKIIKSRSNSSGVEIPLVFDQVNGFDNVLTNFKLLFDLGMLKGNGVSGYYFPELDTVKVKRKDVRKKYAENAEWRELFDKYVAHTLVQLIPGGKLEGMLDHSDEDSDEEEK